MESVQLEHENVTQLVLVSLRDGVEEGRRLSNEEKDPFERIDRGADYNGIVYKVNTND